MRLAPQLGQKPIGVFAGGVSEVELIADATGNISTTVYSQGNLRTASPLEWILDARVYWRRAQQNLPDEKINTAGGFLIFMTAGMAEQLTNLAAQVLWDEGEGGSAIVYEFVASTIVVGDVRDIFKYGGRWVFGAADTTDKLSATLGVVGIMTTVWPIADVFVTSLKILVRRVADTPAAQAFAELVRIIYTEAKAGSFATASRLNDVLQHMVSKLDNYTRFFERGFFRNKDDLDQAGTLFKAYGDHYTQIINKLDASLTAKYGADIAKDKVRNVLSALAHINKTLGIKLSETGVEGLTALAKVDDIDGARLKQVV